MGLKRCLLRYTSRLPLHTVRRLVSTYGSATCGVSSQGKAPTGEACNSQARYSKRYRHGATTVGQNNVSRALGPYIQSVGSLWSTVPQQGKHCTLAYCLQLPEQVGGSSLQKEGRRLCTAYSEPTCLCGSREPAKHNNHSSIAWWLGPRPTGAEKSLQK
jgi:hypothetical protein